MDKTGVFLVFSRIVLIFNIMCIIFGSQEPKTIQKGVDNDRM